MSDPISGGGGVSKATMDAMKEMQQQMNQAQEAGGGQNQTKFQAHMEGAAKNPQDMSVHQVKETHKPTDILHTAKTSTMNPQSQVGQMDHSSKVQKSTKTQTAMQTGMKKMIGDLVNGQNKMEDIMKLATSGKNFSPQQLIALQAGVNRFSQELELTSKVIEKATGSIKQTMNTQV
jgi:hypothetical protein